MIEIDDYIMKNLIYCEDTHSFVHRLWVRFKAEMPGSYKEAQKVAWEVVKEMNIKEAEKSEVIRSA